MIRGQAIPNDRLYEEDHMSEVLNDIEKNGRKYFFSFAPDQKTVALKFVGAIQDYEAERSK